MIDQRKFIESEYTNNDICSLINFLESKLSLNEWYINKINLWTVVRNNLASSIVNNRKQFSQKSTSLSVEEKKEKNNFFIRFFEFIFKSIFGFFQFIAIIIFNLIKIRNIPVILIGDGISKSSFQDAWMDKFLDPLRKYYNTKNINSLLLDVNRFPKENLHSKVFNINNLEKTSYIISRIICFFRKRLIANDQQVIILDKILMNYEIHTDDYSSKNLIITYQQIICLAFFFKLLFRYFNTSKIFLVAYYCKVGYSICYAAHELGIKCVDIQHGILEGHPAYQYWPETLSKNLLLPNLFWVWDRHSYNAFKKNNSRDFLKHHSCFIGGLPWKLLRQRQKNFKNRPAIFNEKKVHILVTMQPDVYDRNLWLKLIPIIHNNPNYCWWIRKHPCFFEQCGQLDEFDHKDFKHIKFSEAFDLPIYTLLENCAINITTDSSSAIDAAIYNVPTLFLSDLCFEFFPHLIQEGKGLYCKTTQAIDQNIQQIIKQNSL